MPLPCKHTLIHWTQLSVKVQDCCENIGLYRKRRGAVARPCSQGRSLELLCFCQCSQRQPLLPMRVNPRLQLLHTLALFERRFVAEWGIVEILSEQLATSTHAAAPWYAEIWKRKPHALDRDAPPLLETKLKHQTKQNVASYQSKHVLKIYCTLG